MNTPLLKGGQGRTPESLRDDASALWLTLLGVVGVVLLLVLRGCVS